MEQFIHLSVNDAKQLLDKDQACFVDIRDPNSFQAGRIKGSIALTNENVEEFIHNADLDRAVVVCCYHGNSSQGAAQFLVGRGFETVYSLDGGFEHWQQLFPEAIDRGA